MPFVVEDGSGLPNATSYLSVEDADAYFEGKRGASTWNAATEAAKQSALMEATGYLDLRWGAVAYGVPVNDLQALVYPRTALPTCARGQLVPQQVKNATAEYALRALSAPLWPDPTVDPSGYAVTRKKEKVGPIEEETEYATSTDGSGVRPAYPSYPSADALLKCLVCPVNARQNRVIRA